MSLTMNMYKSIEIKGKKTVMDKPLKELVKKPINVAPMLSIKDIISTKFMKRVL